MALKKSLKNGQKILKGQKDIYPAEICVLTSCLAVINRWRCDCRHLPIGNGHLGSSEVARTWFKMMKQIRQKKCWMSRHYCIFQVDRNFHFMESFDKITITIYEFRSKYVWLKAKFKVFLRFWSGCTRYGLNEIIKSVKLQFCFSNIYFMIFKNYFDLSKLFKIHFFH